MPAIVRLTPAELMLAASVGAMRRVSDLKRQRRPRFGADKRPPWQIDVCGAIGEIAVAKYTGGSWIGGGALGDFEAPDVDGLEVRWHGRPHYDLRVHKSDRADIAVVMISGDAFVFTLHGWIVAKDGQQPRYWRSVTPGGACDYFVPQSALRPIDALADWLAEYDTRRHVERIAR